MTDHFEYLCDVQEHLRTMIDEAPDDKELFGLAMQAINAVQSVIEHFIPDREDPPEPDPHELTVVDEALERLATAMHKPKAKDG
jgi:hypothetical protein